MNWAVPFLDGFPPTMRLAGSGRTTGHVEVGGLAWERVRKKMSGSREYLDEGIVSVDMKVESLRSELAEQSCKLISKRSRNVSRCMQCFLAERQQ